MERTNAIHRKLVIIGDSACGKTSLLSITSQVPTVFENYITNYLCSLDNVKCKWSKEATRLCPGVPVVLVGLKDLREDPTTTRKIGESSLRFVTEHEGEIVAYEIGAKMYLECSSLSGEGVDTVFEIASRVTLLAVRKVKGEGCCPIL
ncbi:P-loop containing nucleoside triphosphate hydrolase protein [Fusarium oxysporum]|nr:P-loop containing nucleoside triphosphate hydrolase protein [Fusarium oxysporum]